MTRSKKQQGPQPGPMYAVTVGKKNVKVLFSDGSEKFVSRAKMPGAVDLPKIDKATLEVRRSEFVVRGVDKLVASAGVRALAL